MTTRWAIQFPHASLRVAAFARDDAEVEVLVDEATLWLRGTVSDPQLVRSLRAIPGAILYHLLDDGQLVRFGDRVPSTRIPDGAWVPFASVLDFAFPSSNFPGTMKPQLSLRLERDESQAAQVEASVMLTRLT